jgi:type II restriction/modification system DNA methylase subunit YeeA
MANGWLALPLNANGHSNRAVIKKWRNGIDIVRRPLNQWIIDFGIDMSESDAALFETPYEYARELIKPVRTDNRVSRTAEYWWLHRRVVPPLRETIAKVHRYLVTPLVSKHRIFVWLTPDILPGNLLIAFAREDDYFFGVLHSQAHEVWSLRMGTSLEDRPRYTPTTTFETFPLPWPPGEEPEGDPRVQAIAAAAKSLDDLRERWLNPPDASDDDLKKRTLTNLYNAHPTWLANAHAALDRAVWAAYGWDDPVPADVGEDTILSRLLALNLERT